MQLVNIKISNLLSYSYHPNLSKIEGTKFYNKKKNNINILIGPNGSGKSWFLHIISQIFQTGVMLDYTYDKHYITNKSVQNYKKVISLHTQFSQWLRTHFATADKPSQVILKLNLTTYDFDNMRYIMKYREIFNSLIKKYSTLKVSYPKFSCNDIYDIPKSFELVCNFDHKKHTISFDKKSLSRQGKFVLLCMQTLELAQICIDIHNEFERWKTEEVLIPLKNGVAFVSNDRSLKNIPHVINPHYWNFLIAEKNSSHYHAYLWFFLCVKRIWNIMSKSWSLKMTKKEIANYPQRLKDSAFFTSIVYIIKKHLHKTLIVEYRNGYLKFYLVDTFGNCIPFAELSDGEQSFLSMVFIIYGYDLKQGMIIIDEPEIHFHPQMQKTFARMIEKISQNIGTQFIVSTYSPLFINESNIWNVYRFSNIAWKANITNPLFTLTSCESSLVHLLKLENMSKMFFVNTIIMVEWETDAYFFEYYLKHLHTFPEWKWKIKNYEIININGKWSYKVWNSFLSKFGLNSYFLGDWDNVVDYWFMTQLELNAYYKEARSYYASLKKTKKTNRHYNKLVDTIRNIYPKKYRELLSRIDSLYEENVFILKKWDIETYLGMSDKWLDKIVRFCNYSFKKWLEDKRFDTCRKEFEEIFSYIFK